MNILFLVISLIILPLIIITHDIRYLTNQKIKEMNDTRD